MSGERRNQQASKQGKKQTSNELGFNRKRSLEKKYAHASERKELLSDIGRITSRKMDASSETDRVNWVEDGNRRERVWRTDLNLLKKSLEKGGKKGDLKAELVGRDKATRELAGAIAEACTDPIQKKWYRAIAQGLNPRGYGLRGHGKYLSDGTVESVARMAGSEKAGEQRIFDALQKGERPPLADMRKDVGTALDRMWRREDIDNMERIKTTLEENVVKIMEGDGTGSDDREPEIKIIEKDDPLGFTIEELKDHLKESRKKAEEAESLAEQKDRTLEQKLKLQRDKLTDALSTSPERFMRGPASESLGVISEASTLDLLEKQPSLEDAEYPVSRTPKNQVEAKRVGEAIKRGILFGLQSVERGRRMNFEEGESVNVTDNSLEPQDQLRQVALVSFSRKTEVEKAIGEANEIRINGEPFSEASKKASHGSNIPVFILSGQQILGFSQDGKILPLSSKYWLGSYGGSDDPLVGAPCTDLPPGTYVVDLRKGSRTFGVIFSAPEGHSFGILASNTWKLAEDVKTSGEYGVYFSMRSPTRVEGFQQDIKEQGLIVLRVPDERNMMPMKISEKPLMPGGYTTDEAFKIGLALQQAEQYIPEARRESFRNMLHTVPEQLYWAFTGPVGLLYGLSNMAKELGEATAIARSARTSDQIKMAAQRYARVFGDAQTMATITVLTVAASVALKIGISKVKQARYARTVRKNLERASTEKMAIEDLAEGSALEDVTPRVRKPEVRRPSDTQAPAIIVDEGAQGHGHTQKVTAPLKEATDGQIRAARGRRPHIQERPLGGDLNVTLRYGERGPGLHIEPYSAELLSRLGEDAHTINGNQYILRKAGFTESYVKQWITALEEQARTRGFDPRSAEQAVHSHITLEANLIKHMKDRYNLSWAEVMSELEMVGNDSEHVITGIQLLEEGSKFREYLQRAQSNKELPQFSETIVHYERGQAIFRDICRRSGAEALKYVTDLLDVWGRAGLRYMGRHPP